MTRRRFLRLAGLATAGMVTGVRGAARAAGAKAPALGRPNVVFIMADDWGFGDVKCFGKERCRISTPHMDTLAAKGMRFLDAHSSSAVCTPTRYGILTGRYNWRSRLKSSVLMGFSPHLIEDGRETVASFLKKNGYATGCVGKWHVGMDMQTVDGKPPRARLTSKDRDKPLSGDKCNVDWKAPIRNAPTSFGFDYYYGIAASLDMPPYIWIHNDRFVGECTTVKAFHRNGPAHKDFFDYDVLPTIARKACDFVERQAKGDKPFFLYVALNAPHTPISPSKEFRGKSGLGRYADFVMETDWAVGQVVKAIDQAGLADNTLIIATADNGCSPAAANRGVMGSLNITFNGAESKPAEPGRHYSCGIYRGHKADIYEGGHRIPFIARWVGKVKASSACNDTTCLIDLYATCAEILGKAIPDNAAEDSVSMLPNLLGTATGPVREATVHHSINGSFSIRQGKWKLEFCPGSGGWSAPRPGSKEALAGPSHQLYDLSKDSGENKNLYTDEHPAARKLTMLMKKYISDGRSTPGKPQKNTGKTSLYLRGRRKR